MKVSNRLLSLLLAVLLLGSLPIPAAAIYNRTDGICDRWN